MAETSPEPKPKALDRARQLIREYHAQSRKEMEGLTIHDLAGIETKGMLAPEEKQLIMKNTYEEYSKKPMFDKFKLAIKQLWPRYNQFNELA